MWFAMDNKTALKLLSTELWQTYKLPFFWFTTVTAAFLLGKYL